MNRYGKLVNFELNRFLKIYLFLLIITALSQFIGVVVESRSFLAEAQRMITEQNYSPVEYVQNYNNASFSSVTNSIWFVGPIALCIVTLVLYIFLIWYRDWFGKNTFIYRLLMLPAARLSVYLSKATAILLLVLGLVAFQLIMLPLQNALFESLVPEVFIESVNTKALIQNNFVLLALIPSTLTDFVLSYGAGMAAVFTLFTAIMIERSFRMKGIIPAVIYCVAAVVFFFSPLFFADGLLAQLYPGEIFALFIGLGIIIIAISIWLGNWLLNKKVTV